MSRIDDAFVDGPAFIPYLAAGDPDYAASQAYVEAVVEGGADLVELGLPFSDPVADGATIREATVRSLSAGMTPERYFAFVDDLDVEVPLVCMTYYNLLYRYGDAEGPQPFVRKAAEVGIDGFVVPDLPPEEAAPLQTACDEFDRDLVFIVAPTTDDTRLKRIRELGSGYVYVQARLGTTGARSDLSDQTTESLDRLAHWDLPKAVGFGISAPEHAKRVVAAGADGVIVGSALVDRIADGVDNDRPTAAIAAELEDYTASLAAGARRGVTESEGT